MQFGISSLRQPAMFVKLGTGLLLSTSALLIAYAQVPSKYANDTFTLITRSDHGKVKIHLQGEGDHCWASNSSDHSIVISMGDDRCTSRPWSVPDDALVFARITRKKISFHLDGKAYSIDDPNTVKIVRNLFGPLVAIEAQQSELGAKQRALGEKQSELGHRQTEVKVSVPDMGSDFHKIEADAKRLSSQGATRSELGDLQSELGDLQSRIGDLQSQAGDSQSKLGDQQSELGDQQSKIGDQQSDLAEKGQLLIVDITAKLQATLTQAVKSGTAKPE